MAHLSLSLLGSFQVTLDGQAVTDFESNKVRALLAYLAVDVSRPHRRDTLAGLLWPNRTDRAALSNLRYALSNLRGTIGDRTAAPPFLLITRDTLQFNMASDHWLDVKAFTDLLAGDEDEASSPFASSQSTIDRLGQAIALYRGSLLEGFSVGESPAFEEWLLFKREQIGLQMLTALHRLAALHERRGEYEPAQAYARQQLELEPWQEEAHQQLMRLLALSNQRSAALAQYATCRRLLARELGVEPARETTALYESIRDGTLGRGAEGQWGRGGFSFPAPPRPSTLAPPPPGPAAPFVARERELAKLDQFLEMALAGQGRVIFVTGDAGSGKTALVAEFARRAMQARADVVVAFGNCNAHSGIGDPYLPFREIMQMLTGDVEAKRAGGAITREHARRLWALLPTAMQALGEAGPDLVDLLVPGAALAIRAEAFAPGGADWRTRLQELVKHKAASNRPATLPQMGLFEQVTRVLQALARRQALILVLDDLQWADAGSISLLFHLGRRLAVSRILIIGACRPDDVALGRDGECHALEPIINEFRRDFGDILLDLGQCEGRQFVDAFLDTEPNRLRATFRETLYRHTGGNPLFTIELVRGLQERGDLVQDDAGRWVERPSSPPVLPQYRTGVGGELDWEQLPARVEAVIAECINRLPPQWRAALAVASVEGEEFTAEVVARVQAGDEGEIVQYLSGPLSKQQRLVRAQSLQRLGEQRLSRYRFRHYLFQKYVYHSLDEVERAYLHQAVGNALEALYEENGAEMSAIAPQLAWHFEAAGLVHKAVAYLLLAGKRAFHLSANQEAIALFKRGLALLEILPESPQRTQGELNLQLALSAPLLATRGWGAPERAQAVARAYELCQGRNGTSQSLQALFLQADCCRAKGEHQKSLALGQQLFSLAQPSQDPLQVALAHWSLGASRFFLGEFTQARDHLEQAIAFYEPQQHACLKSLTGVDMGVTCLAWTAWVLWVLGYPDQALKRSREALVLAQELDHPLTLGFALAVGGSGFHLLRRESQVAQEWAEGLMRLATQKDLALFQAWGAILQGRGQVEQGRVEEGLAHMHQGLAAWQASGTQAGRPHHLLLLAGAYRNAHDKWGRDGQAAHGLNALDEALALVEESGGRYFEAEIYRLRGELLLAQAEGIDMPAASPDAQSRQKPAFIAEAEAHYRRAIEVAHRQQAKSWELRATMSLARLLQRQGKQAEARHLLAEIYDWFGEGWDTPDLQEARGLLEELAGK